MLLPAAVTASVVSILLNAVVAQIDNDGVKLVGRCDACRPFQLRLAAVYHELQLAGDVVEHLDEGLDLLHTSCDQMTSGIGGNAAELASIFALRKDLSQPRASL